jgi:hypothetical protein
MAGGNIIETQVLEDGDRNTVIKWILIGDNKTGDEVNTIVFDASEYKTASLSNKVYEITYTTDGVSARLDWDATANILLYSLPGNHSGSFRHKTDNSIINDAGAGVTGDILITTNNMNDGDSITLLIWMKERELSRVR